MVGLLLILLIAGEGFSLEVLDKCEVKYKRCAFDCVQEFPLDKEKRGGCLTRCKFDKGLCKAKEGAEKTINSIKKFLEGFSKEGK